MNARIGGIGLRETITWWTGLSWIGQKQVLKGSMDKVIAVSPSIRFKGGYGETKGRGGQNIEKE